MSDDLNALIRDTEKILSEIPSEHTNQTRNDDLSFLGDDPETSTSPLGGSGGDSDFEIKTPIALKNDSDLRSPLVSPENEENKRESDDVDIKNYSGFSEQKTQIPNIDVALDSMTKDVSSLADIKPIEPKLSETYGSSRKRLDFDLLSPVSIPSGGAAVTGMTSTIDLSGMGASGVSRDLSGMGDRRSKHSPVCQGGSIFGREVATPFKDSFMNQPIITPSVSSPKMRSKISPISGLETPSDVSGGFSDRWAPVNRLLSQNGFAMMVEDGIHNESETVCLAFQEVLKQFAARGKMVQEMIASSESIQEVQDTAKENRRSSEEQVYKQKIKLKEAQNRLQLSSESFAQTERRLKESLRESDARLGRVKRKYAQAKHTIRAREKETERAQQKVHALVAKEERRRSQADLIFKQLKQRAPRKTSSKDSDCLEIVTVFEAQRRHMQKEIDFLRKEVVELNARLCDSANLSEVDPSESEKKKKKKEVNCFGDVLGHSEAAGKKNDLAERKLGEMLKKSLRNLQDATDRIKVMEDERANLMLELESRPTVRDWKGSQQQIYRLKRQLNVQQSRSAMLRGSKSADTRALIRYDRDVSALGLRRLDALPAEVVTELLRDVCRELRVGGAELVMPAIKKLEAIVDAVPAMEKFISKVCSLLFPPDISSEKEPPSHKKLIAEAIPKLEKWAEEREKLASLSKLRSSVIKSLTNRPLQPKLDIAEEAGEKIRTKTVKKLNNSEIVEQIEELVKSEDYLTHAKEVFQHAKDDMKSHPSALPSRVVSHFQHLFGVRALEGVFPKMNELFLFVGEAENFLRALRSALDLDTSASISACFASLQSILNERRPNSLKLQPQPLDSRASAHSVTDGDLVARLARVFGSPERSDEVVKMCERIVDRCAMFDSVFPRLDSLVCELRAALRVDKLGDILPAVRALVETHPNTPSGEAE
eukprot:209960_1